MDTTVEALAILDAVIGDYAARPIDLLNLGDGPGESAYIRSARPSYARTIGDLIAFWESCGSPERSSFRILETGAFLGVVSVALARFGFTVTAFDLPLFFTNQRLMALLAANRVTAATGNLKHPLPVADGAFDAVVMCETLEHLNFNPLPLVVEINRVLRTGGGLYLSLPNVANLHNRLALLRGRSFHNPIRDYFNQLDATKNMSVGLHWREYTGNEVREILEGLGFRLTYQRYFHSADLAKPRLTPKALLSAALHGLFPALKPNQTTLACKVAAPTVTFALSDANYW